MGTYLNITYSVYVSHIRIDVMSSVKNHVENDRL